MPPIEEPPEPWQSFFSDVDSRLSKDIQLHCCGGFVATQLYGIKGNDPWVAGASMAVLIVVASVAGFLPAHRASRINPILALRYE